MRRGWSDTLVARLFGVLALVALLACATTAIVVAVVGSGAARGERLDALRRQAAVISSVVGAAGVPRSAQLRVVEVGEQPGPGGRGPRGVGPGRGGLFRTAPGDAAVARALSGRDAGEGSVRVAGRELLYVLRDTPAGPLAVVRASGALPGDARPRADVLLLAGLLGLLIAAAAAVPLSRFLARPLLRLRTATGALARGEPIGPLQPGGTRELTELAAAVEALDDDLRRSRTAERRLLAAVSHELRTPLTSLRGWTEALEDGHATSEEALPILRAETDRLDRLVGDLLELGRAGAADLPLADEELDLRALADEVVARHVPEARRAGVTLTAQHPVGPARAHGDRERLLQVASNLVDNAVRVTPAGGHVTVEVAPGRLAVADDGPGLAPEDRERAFEALHLHRRLGPGRAGRAGLGLALVAELIRAMGGRAIAEPGPGGGTRFVVELRP